MGRGDYEIRGDGAGRVLTGECAKCTLPVLPGEPSVVLHHATQRGGIFHQGCAPTTDGWFSPADDDAEPA